MIGKDGLWHRPIHPTVPVLVWVDVDEGIAHLVRELNDRDDVRTLASCQGTIGEGGAHPYRPQVMVEWTQDYTLKHLLFAGFDITLLGPRLAYIHPPSTTEPVPGGAA